MAQALNTKEEQVVVFGEGASSELRETMRREIGLSTTQSAKRTTYLSFKRT